MAEGNTQSKTTISKEQLAEAKALFDAAIIKIVASSAEVIKNYVMIFFANGGKLTKDLNPQAIPFDKMTPEFKKVFDLILTKVLAKLNDDKVNDFFEKLGKAANDPNFKLNLLQAISLQHVETLFKQLNELNPVILSHDLRQF